MLTFTITDREQQQIDKWLETLKPQIIEKQKQTFSSTGYATLTNNGTEPYYGPINGGITFMFIPTGIGTIKIVKEALTNEELDLTNYNLF